MDGRAAMAGAACGSAPAPAPAAAACDAGGGAACNGPACVAERKTGAAGAPPPTTAGMVDVRIGGDTAGALAAAAAAAAGALRGRRAMRYGTVKWSVVYARTVSCAMAGVRKWPPSS